MPNYKYVATTRFQPFTFDEMLKPALLAQAKHDEIEKAYGELGENAEEWGSRIDEINDPIAYARYKQYQDSFDENYQNFSKHGLNHKSNKALMDVKRYYKNRVKPIEDAWTTRKALQDEVRKLQVADPTLFVQNDILNPGAGSSLDNWLNNPSYDYGQTYSGAMITKQAVDALAPVAKSLMSYGKGQAIDEYTNTFLKNLGYTPDRAYKEMQDYLANPNAANNFVSKSLKAVMDSTGMASWASPEDMTRAYNYAAQGIRATIGTSDVTPIENYAARQTLINSYKNPNGSSGNNNGEKQYVITPRSAVTKANLEDYISKSPYRQYFDRDEKGNFTLNQKGMKEYMRAQDASRGGKTNPTGGGYAKNEFRNFVENELGIKLNVTRAQEGKVGTGYYMSDATKSKIGSKFSDYIKQQSGVVDPTFYDTYETTKYALPYETDDGKKIMDQIMAVSPNGLDVVRIENKNGKVGYNKYGPKRLSSDDLDGAYVVETNTSIYGNTATIKTKKNGTVEVRLPEGINQGAEDKIKQITSNIDTLRKEYYDELAKPNPDVNTLISISSDVDNALMGLEDTQHSIFGFKSYKASNEPSINQYISPSSQRGVEWYSLLTQ